MPKEEFLRKIKEELELQENHLIYLLERKGHENNEERDSLILKKTQTIQALKDLVKSYEK